MDNSEKMATKST